MRRSLLSTALFAAIAFSFGSAQTATFNYHGNLQDAGKPNPAGSYLGTVDRQLLIIKADNSEAAKLSLRCDGTATSWIGGGSLDSTTGHLGESS